MINLNKILVTGATGFIGSHLIQRLIEEKFEVGILKRENSNVWRIENLLDKISIYNVDLRNTQEVYKAVSCFRPDAIIHLAAYYSTEHKQEEISSMIDTNVLGTVNLLEVSKEFGIKLFINTSSCFIYKESENKLREDADLNPLNLYALTKLQAEQACTFYAEKYGLRIVTFRLFPPYGPKDHERRLIPYVIKSLLNGNKPRLTTGMQKWDFVYVSDIVEAYFKLLSTFNLPIKHEIFNIGTGNATSVREVVSQINEIVGSDIEPEWGVVPHRKNEVWFICADIQKTVAFLGWSPKTQILKEGLELTVKWCKNSLVSGKKMKNTEIEGVIIEPLEKIPDGRGYIYSMLRSDDPVFEKFGEIDFSAIYPDSVKAWHFHKKTTLNYAVIQGMIKLVLYDDREDSLTKGNLMELFIGEENYCLVKIPPKIWNGFKGIGNKPALVANCATLPYDPSEIVRISPFADRIPYNWRLSDRNMVTPCCLAC